MLLHRYWAVEQRVLPSREVHAGSEIRAQPAKRLPYGFKRSRTTLLMAVMPVTNVGSTSG